MSMTTPPRWRERLRHIDARFDHIRLPDVDSRAMPQDEEWCEVVLNGDRRRVRFHDYDQIYRIPGLYEKIFYERLQCCSPSRVVRLLASVVEDRGERLADLRVLDLGAGNGMVADELSWRGVRTLLGVDILPEAKEAALRDRPGIYQDYWVADFSKLPAPRLQELKHRDLNCLVSVAALGFDDIPTEAFLTALRAIRTPGWVAFNIKESFLYEEDGTGFSKLIQKLRCESTLQVEAYRRYRHRLSITGEPLYYVAMVATKIQDVDASSPAVEKR